MKYKNVLILGGSGFVGRSVANRLAAQGVQLCIPTRKRARVSHLLLLPTADVVEADIGDEATLDELVSRADAVVNLVGVLHSRSGEPYGEDFRQAHVDLPKRLIAACRKHGVKRVVHVSALGAAQDAPSAYQRSKAAGEAAIRAGGPEVEWTILRPSVIFGPGDNFLNQFARLLKVVPVLPVGGAKCRFQPVYVEDVAELVACSLEWQEAVGQTWDAAGPRVYTLEELIEYAGKASGSPALAIPLPRPLAMVQARLLEFLPQPPMSRDNLRSMEVDNVAAGEPLPFGAQPTPLENIAPLYLAPLRRRAQFFGTGGRRREV